jgi:hypothetical protein
MTEIVWALTCCCLAAAGSRIHRQDRTFDELEAGVGTKLHGQAAVASQQEKASRGKPTGSKFEGRMAGLVSRQALRQASLHTCFVLDSEPELAEQESNGNLLQAQAAALARSGQSLEVLSQ